MATCRLTLDVTYDPKVTSADDVATALDTVLSNGLSTEGITDEVGEINVAHFEVAIESDIDFPDDFPDDLALGDDI